LDGEGDDEEDGNEHRSNRIIPSRGVSVSDLIVSPDKGVERIEHEQERDREKDESIDLCVA
jgi:hypothetical protein